MRQSRRNILRPAFVLACPVVLGGCAKACGDDKPYVPYSISSASSTSTLQETSPTSSASHLPQARFAPVMSTRVMGGPPAIDTSSGRLVAPDGMVFVQLLEVDLTGDQRPDSLAWVRSSDGTSQQLVQFGPSADGSLRATSLVALPSDLARMGNCSPDVRLSQVGSRTVSVSYQVECSTKDPRAMSWSVAVVPSKSPTVRLEVRSVSRGADRLKVEFDGLDRDGDSLDDLLVVAELVDQDRVSKQDPLSVVFRFFDRPAGLSRDPHEPTASLDALGKRILRDAKSSTKRAEVLQSARRFRALHGIVCLGEGETSLQVGQTPLRCGPNDGLASVVQAEYRAQVVAKDWVGAIGTFQRTMMTGRNADLVALMRKELEQKLEVQKSESYGIPFGGEARTSKPLWSSLAFAVTGELLVRTNTSVMRFDASKRVALPDPESPLVGWSRSVAAPSGAKVLERVVSKCDGQALVALVASNGELREWRLPIDSERSNRCAGKPLDVDVVPIAWNDQGLSLVVDGLPVTVVDEGVGRPELAWTAGSLGSAMAADGKTVALPTLLGVLVATKDSGRLWRGNLDHWDHLRGCVVSKGATAVACLDGSQTVIMLPSL